MKSRSPEERRKQYIKHQEYNRAAEVKRGMELKQWFRDYKKTLKCERCPESTPCCLEFHHIDPSKKEININKALQRKWSKKKILEEISKCHVLCANCHRKEHAAQRALYQNHSILGTDL